MFHAALQGLERDQSHSFGIILYLNWMRIGKVIWEPARHCMGDTKETPRRKPDQCCSRKIDKRMKKKKKNLGCMIETKHINFVSLEQLVSHHILGDVT